jgi:hypothetical protein
MGSWPSLAIDWQTGPCSATGRGWPQAATINPNATTAGKARKNGCMICLT